MKPPKPSTLLRIFALASLLIVAGVAGYQWYAQQRQVVYVIPAGTAARIAAGEQVEVLPQTIELQRGVRDVLVIRNDDTQTVQVGPYLIAPGQSYTQRYNSRGTFDMLCTIHPSQQLRVVVK